MCAIFFTFFSITKHIFRRCPQKIVSLGSTHLSEEKTSEKTMHFFSNSQTFYVFFANFMQCVIELVSNPSIFELMHYTREQLLNSRRKQFFPHAVILYAFNSRGDSIFAK
jgi:hypothetical protein